jgi:hypothetical protein
MSEPVNWMDRLDAMVSWPQRHPYFAKILGGIVFFFVGALMLIWRVKTIGHD